MFETDHFLSGNKWHPIQTAPLGVPVNYVFGDGSIMYMRWDHEDGWELHNGKCWQFYRGTDRPVGWRPAEPPGIGGGNE